MSPRRNSTASPSSAQWLALPESLRAVVVRNRADQQFLAIQQQHERIVGRSSNPLLLGQDQSARAETIRLMIDVDLFALSVRRLHRVCDLVRRSRLATGSLRQPMNLFEHQVAGVAPFRDMLEHLDDAAVSGQGGVGYGLGPNGVLITFDGAKLDTLALLQAARQLHAAIRAVIDPIADQDVHGGHPIIDMPIAE